jgi:NADPH:quinone reductase-like Zn-dependent oxidoreductase
MRAYQLPKGGAGIDALVKIERPNPTPAYRQVLVKVMACSLNFRDLGIVRGTYRMPVRDNIVPLSDGAGEVVEVGAGVTRVKVGDKVAGCFFQRWSGGEAPLAKCQERSLPRPGFPPGSCPLEMNLFIGPTDRDLPFE